MKPGAAADAGATHNGRASRVQTLRTQGGRAHGRRGCAHVPLP